MNPATLPFRNATIFFLPRPHLHSYSLCRNIVPWCFFIAFFAILAGCSSTAILTTSPSTSGSPANSASNNAVHLPVLPPAGSGRGGYYQDDGPGDSPPAGLLELPNPIPKIEPYSLTGNKPYIVFGQTYTPLVSQQPFRQRGTGSWYGKKFHGQKTSSGELYDMYKLTAAHPTLPIPSYARVTNLNNGAQIIVRINDRGPFHSSRIIDLSYTAALKLGYLGKGSGQLEVERLLPEEIARMNSEKQRGTVAPVALVDTSIQSIPPTLVMPAQTTETLLTVTSLQQGSNRPAEQSLITTPIISPPIVTDNPGLAVQPSPSQSSFLPPVSLASENKTVPSGFYVQFGAFSELGNAEGVRTKLLQNWDSSLPPLEVAFVGLFYRLQGGPFATRGEAAAVVQKMQATGEIKPMVVQR